MLIFKNKKRWISIFVLVTVITLTTAIGSFYFKNSTVSALPCSEYDITYYSDSTYTVEVGERFITCSGVYTTGQVTQFKITYYIGDCGNCNMNLQQ